MGLVLFFSPTGRLTSSWQLPESPVEELYRLDLPVRLAQQAEKAKFDAIFFANTLFRSAATDGQVPYSTGYEPLTLLSGVAAHTSHIGLVATASMSFVHPFNMARFFSSIDWLSNGRVAWNAVTSSGGSEHYGFALPPKAERYHRAHEFMDVVNRLWDAFDDDAVVNDRKDGQWLRPGSVHPVGFEGEYFKVDGHLHMTRSPQGRPVIVQAGQSSDGMDFAAKHAEVVFTAQTELDAAQEFYRDLKSRAVAIGRDPNSIKILPGLTTLVGKTAKDAEASFARLGALVKYDDSLRTLGQILQTDLSNLDPDRPIPLGFLPKSEDVERDRPGGGRYDNYKRMAEDQTKTLRDIVILNRVAGGHGLTMGSFSDVADHMQEWFEERGCDGFAIGPATNPGGYDEAFTLLVPELQRRGLAKTEYVGTTLRENLGLERPAATAR